MDKNMTPHRQGDLFFVPRPNHRKCDWSKKHPAFRKNGVIREGEATGHLHRIKDLETANLFIPQDGKPIIVVGPKGATIEHVGNFVGTDKPHGPIQLEPDTTYDVHFPRENDLTAPQQMRYVAD